MLELSQPETLWQHANILVVVNMHATYLPETTIREERSAEIKDEQTQANSKSVSHGDQAQLHKLRVPVCHATRQIAWLLRPCTPNSYTTFNISG